MLLLEEPIIIALLLGAIAIALPVLVSSPNGIRPSWLRVSRIEVMPPPDLNTGELYQDQGAAEAIPKHVYMRRDGLPVEPTTEHPDIGSISDDTPPNTHTPIMKRRPTDSNSFIWVPLDYTPPKLSIPVPETPYKSPAAAEADKGAAKVDVKGSSYIKEKSSLAASVNRQAVPNEMIRSWRHLYKRNENGEETTSEDEKGEELEGRDVKAGEKERRYGYTRKRHIVVPDAGYHPEADIYSPDGSESQSMWSKVAGGFKPKVRLMDASATGPAKKQHAGLV